MTETTQDGTVVTYPVGVPFPGETDTPKNVHQAILAVMAEVEKIGKDRTFEGRSKADSFNFRGVDDVVNAIGPVARKHGIYPAPINWTILNDERYESRNGAKMRNVTVEGQWDWTDANGNTKAVGALGEAADSGDKAVSKAQSVAYRVMMLQTFCIPTGEPDPDSQVHERASDTQREAQPVDPAREEWLDQMKQAGAEITKLQGQLGWTDEQIRQGYTLASKGGLLNEATLEGRKMFVEYLTASHINHDREPRDPYKQPPRAMPRPDAGQHVAGGPYPEVPVGDLVATIRELQRSLQLSDEHLASMYAHRNNNERLQDANPAGLQEFIKQLRWFQDARQDANDEARSQVTDAELHAEDHGGVPDEPPS